VGDSVHTVTIYSHPKIADVDGGPVQAVCFMIAMAAITAVMLTFAPGTGRGRERLHWWLDSVTVLVGGGALAWFVAFDNNLGGADRDEVTATLIGAGVVLIMLFAAVRMILSRSAPVTQLAAAPMLVSMFIQCLAVWVAPVEPGTHVSSAVFAIRILPSTLSGGRADHPVPAVPAEPEPVRDPSRAAVQLAALHRDHADVYRAARGHAVECGSAVVGAWSSARSDDRAGRRPAVVDAAGARRARGPPRGTGVHTTP
jgi:hypothetical protein